MRTRYRWSEAEKKLLPIDEWMEKYGSTSNASHMIMPDIAPYKSMIDGSVISSRSQHRKHLRDHDCVEVGNDSSIKNPQYQPPKPPPGLKEKIIRAVDEVTRRR